MDKKILTVKFSIEQVPDRFRSLPKHVLRVITTTVSFSRTLAEASMAALASLLVGLPLQPEESDRGDPSEAKSTYIRE